MLTDNPAVPLILIVEDDNSHALLIQRSFENAPDEYRLEWAGSISAARTVMEQHPSDLVLTDYQLPDGEGSEIVALAAGACPVIIMTSHGNEQIAVEAMKIGAQDYIVKSADAFEALPRTVAQALKVWSLIQARRQALEATEKSEQQFRSFVENANDVLFTLSPSGIFTYISPQWQDFTGYEQSDTIGQSFSPFVHADDIAGCLEFLHKVIESGEKQSGFEFRVLIKDGTYQWYTVNASCVVDLVTGTKALVGIGRDISAQKRAEEANAKLEAHLNQAQKMEAIGVLAGGIAHDFNNILGAILGYTEIARDEAPPESSIAKSLDKVLEASQRATALVKQILAFSRQVNLRRIPLNISHIVKEAIKLLRPSIPSTIEIRQQIDSSFRPILADSTQVHQIIMNLCTNAYYAMEQTGGVLQITLEDCELYRTDLQKRPEVQPGGFVKLSISDTGAGIDPNIRSRIFEPYFTTKEVGKGTGMGLSIVHGIVASYGGFVTCESEIGKGTVFNVFFPAIEEPAPTEVKPMAATPSGTERILFIDDEEILAEMGKIMLERLGYEVTIRTSSLDALATFQNQPGRFDVVITDQTMPGMTGFDLARRMLQIRPNIPIILCTGYSNLVNEEQAKIFGIKGFIMKPMSKKEIAKCLRTVLDENRRTE